MIWLTLPGRYPSGLLNYVDVFYRDYDWDQVPSPTFTTGGPSRNPSGYQTHSDLPRAAQALYKSWPCQTPRFVERKDLRFFRLRDLTSYMGLMIILGIYGTLFGNLTHFHLFNIFVCIYYVFSMWFVCDCKIHKYYSIWSFQFEVGDLHGVLESDGIPAAIQATNPPIIWFRKAVPRRVNGFIYTKRYGTCQDGY